MKQRSEPKDKLYPKRIPRECDSMDDKKLAYFQRTALKEDMLSV